MDTATRLLDDIRNAPDDDDPRLVWADAVGGERGELVVVQCKLERGGLSAKEALALRRRQRELLAQHGVAWSGLEPYAKRASFRRGFVDAAAIPIRDLLAHAGAIAEAAPLLDALTTDLTQLHGEPAERLGALIEKPLFSRIRALDLLAPSAHRHEYLPAESRSDECIELVVERALPKLTAFGIGGRVTDRGVRALANVLDHLARLRLDSTATAGVDVDVDFDFSEILEGKLSALRALDIRTPIDRLATLQRGVVELRIGNVTIEDGTFGRLVASPAAATLERLAINCANLVTDMRLFARLPKLRALAFEHRVELGPPTIELSSIRTFASLKLPALRELAITAPMPQESVFAVAEAFGPQLELLDLRGNHHALRHVNSLKRMVAGELLVKHPFAQGTELGLLRAAPTTQAAWWDHVTIHP